MSLDVLSTNVRFNMDSVHIACAEIRKAADDLLAKADLLETVFCKNPDASLQDDITMQQEEAFRDVVFGFHKIKNYAADGIASAEVLLKDIDERTQLEDGTFPSWVQIGDS